MTTIRCLTCTRQGYIMEITNNALRQGGCSVLRRFWKGEFHMKKLSKLSRVLSLILCAACLMTVCAMPVSAEGEEDTTEEVPAPAVPPAAPVLSFKYFEDFRVALIIDLDVSTTRLTYTLNGYSTTVNAPKRTEIIELRLPRDSGIYVTAVASNAGGDSPASSLTIQGYAVPTNRVLRVVNSNWGAHFFTDVQIDAWYKDDLNRLMKSGAVKGITQTTFEPDSSMTVAQYTKMLLCTMYSEEMIQTYYGSKTGPWYKPYMDFGAVVLFSDGLLTAEDADRPITRYEMAELLARAYKIYVPANKYQAAVSGANPDKIADYDSIPQERRKAVLVAYATKMLNGMDDAGTFAGDEGLTRCQACASVVRLFGQI